MSPEERLEALQTEVHSLRTIVSEILKSMLPSGVNAIQTCPTCALHEEAGEVLQTPHRELLPDFETAIVELKRKLLSEALANNDGVMKHAAVSLSMKYTTFVEMAHRLGVVKSGRRLGNERRYDARRFRVASVTSPETHHASARQRHVA